jgi:hypothetical protein
MDIAVWLTVLGSIASAISALVSLKFIFSRTIRPEKLSIVIGDNTVVVEASQEDIQKMMEFLKAHKEFSKYNLKVEELPPTKQSIKPVVRLEHPANQILKIDTPQTDEDTSNYAVQ